MLEGLLPVRFVSTSSGTNGSRFVIAGELTDGAPSQCLEPVPTLRISADHSTADETAGQNVQIAFADGPDVPWPFRCRSIIGNSAGGPAKLSVAVNERVLARIGDLPVWTISNHNGFDHYVSAFGLPNLSANLGFKDICNEKRFIQFLPLLHFLQSVCRSEQFVGPALRACLMFDDPNLHWKRYGYVDFAEIAAHAERENYHVAFATIPLDTWWTHRETARLFHDHPGQISLLVHGNNHTRMELAQRYGDHERVALLRQALNRVTRMERASDVRVGRVMVPPHGACAEAMLGELPRCGFEGACISHGSLRAHNPQSTWNKTAGYFPSEMIKGCPVLPRWGFSAGTKSAVLLAAFLRQPIVLRAHQQDLKGDGVELLDEHARFINGLGAVTWANPESLLQTNYQTRISGNIFWVKPFSRSITIELPDNASILRVKGQGQSTPARWTILTGDNAEHALFLDEDFRIAEHRARVVRLRASPPSDRPTEPAGPPRLNVRPIIRRLLTETRDRLAI